MNLAVALANQHGLRVGLMDADVYGPSIPKLLNLHGGPHVSAGCQNFNSQTLNANLVLSNFTALTRALVLRRTYSRIRNRVHVVDNYIHKASFLEDDKRKRKQTDHYCK